MDIASRYVWRPQQVHGWRRMVSLGQLALPNSAETPSFVPLVSESLVRPALECRGPLERVAITVDLLGARVELRRAPNLAVLSDMFLGLRRTHSC